MTIGENIRRIRKENNLTQKQLGNLCGMADSAIRRYELGKSIPKLKTLHKIAKGLGIPVHTLVEGCGPEYRLSPRADTADSINRHNKKTEYIWDDWLHFNNIHFISYKTGGTEGTLLKFPDTKELYFLTKEQTKLLPSLSIEQTKILIKAMALKNIR
jgi:transcriptional regulator with XRE-family HTH domain